jgi:hypothetical protein
MSTTNETATVTTSVGDAQVNSNTLRDTIKEDLDLLLRYQAHLATKHGHETNFITATP